MALTTMDGLVAALPGQVRSYHKVSTAPKAAGSFHSLFYAPGVPGAPAIPGASLAWSVMTQSDAGAIKFSNPGGGALSYLSRLCLSTTSAHTIIIYDRLAQTGAITPAASTQTLTGGPTLTRPDATGADVECWIESLTASTSTASNYSIRYKDQDDNASETSPTIAATTTSVVGMMQRFNLNSGDTGVRSVDQFISTGASGGTAQLVLLRRLAEFSATAANLAPIIDFFTLGAPRIYDSACLGVMLLANSTTAVTISGTINIAQG
jgi:hypothetical protein